MILAEALAAAIHDGRLGRNVARGVKLPKIEQREAPSFGPEVSIGSSTPCRSATGPSYGSWGRSALASGKPRRCADGTSTRCASDCESRSRSERSAGRLITPSTKTHAARTIPLPRSIADKLAALGRGPVQYLFTAPQGGPVRYRSFEGRIWKPALERLDLPAVGLHVLRH